MKICIPVRDECGLDAVPHDPFGSAPFFAIADTGTDDLEFVVNRAARPREGQGRCDPIADLPSLGIEAVVCSGMGRRALVALAREKIGVYVADGKTVRDVLATVRAGGMRLLTADRVCTGRGPAPMRGHGHGASFTGA